MLKNAGITDDNRIWHLDHRYKKKPCSKRFPERMQKDFRFVKTRS